MKIQSDELHIAGISVRTSNENNQAATDIPALWQQFIAENIKEKLPERKGDEIYCLYTDYEKDHTKPYTTILGYAVQGTENIPEGMICNTIAAGNYKIYEVSGAIWEGAVFDMWVKIWDAGIARAYTTDFEVYGPTSPDAGLAKMKIFIALKDDNTPG